MKANRKPPQPLAILSGQPRNLVARLILAEAIAKRGRGPLERPVRAYRRKR